MRVLPASAKKKKTKAALPTAANRTFEGGRRCRKNTGGRIVAPRPRQRELEDMQRNSTEGEITVCTRGLRPTPGVTRLAPRAKTVFTSLGFYSDARCSRTTSASYARPATRSTSRFRRRAWGARWRAPVTASRLSFCRRTSARAMLVLGGWAWVFCGGGARASALAGGSATAQGRGPVGEKNKKNAL